MVVSVVYFIV